MAEVSGHLQAAGEAKAKAVSGEAWRQQAVTYLLHAGQGEGKEVSGEA
jgi:hypothetical protein